MEVLPSALKHKVTEQAIRHAVDNAIVNGPLEDSGGDLEDGEQLLIIGPDLAGNILEIVAIDDSEGLVVIHAMPLRAKYHHLLP